MPTLLIPPSRLDQRRQQTTKRPQSSMTIKSAAGLPLWAGCRDRRGPFCAEAQGEGSLVHADGFDGNSSFGLHFVYDPAALQKRGFADVLSCLRDRAEDTRQQWRWKMTKHLATIDRLPRPDVDLMAGVQRSAISDVVRSRSVSTEAPGPPTRKRGRTHTTCQTPR